MQCTKCKYPHTNLVKIKHDEQLGVTTRRRECVKCGTRFNTQEALKPNSKPDTIR